MDTTATTSNKPLRGLSDAATSPAPQAMARDRRRPFLILAAVAAAAVLLVGVYALVNANVESTDDAQIEADIVPLAVRAGGLVLQMMVQDNQRVKAGDVIMQLDEAELAARVKQSEAELETARAQAAAAEAQARVVEASAKGGLQSARAQLSGSSGAVSSAAAQVASAKAGIERAKADAHKAENDLSRAKTLRAANAISEERLDNAQAARDAAAAALEQALALLTAAQQGKIVAESHVAEAEGHLSQSTPIEAQIAAAHAAVDLGHAGILAASARLDLQRLQFSYLKVTAPVDGVVSRLSAHVGQLLQTGQAVAELVPLETYVVANFKETQVGRMKPGQPARIRIDGLPGHELLGKVESLSGGTGARFSLLPPDNASGNFVKVVQRVPVRVRWSDVPPALTLRPGLSAEVTVDTGKE